MTQVPALYKCCKFIRVKEAKVWKSNVGYRNYGERNFWSTTSEHCCILWLSTDLRDSKSNQSHGVFKSPWKIQTFLEGRRLHALWSIWGLIRLRLLSHLDEKKHFCVSAPQINLSGTNLMKCFNRSGDLNPQAYLSWAQQFSPSAWTPPPPTVSIPLWNSRIHCWGRLEEKVLGCLFHFLLSRGDGQGVNQLAMSQTPGSELHTGWGLTPHSGLCCSCLSVYYYY